MLKTAESLCQILQIKINNKEKTPSIKLLYHSKSSSSQGRQPPVQRTQIGRKQQLSWRQMGEAGEFHQEVGNWPDPYPWHQWPASAPVHSGLLFHKCTISFQAWPAQWRRFRWLMHFGPLVPCNSWNHFRSPWTRCGLRVGNWKLISMTKKQNYFHLNSSFYNFQKLFFFFIPVIQNIATIKYLIISLFIL